MISRKNVLLFIICKFLHLFSASSSFFDCSSFFDPLIMPPHTNQPQFGFPMMLLTQFTTFIQLNVHALGRLHLYWMVPTTCHGHVLCSELLPPRTNCPLLMDPWCQSIIFNKRASSCHAIRVFITSISDRT